HVLALALGLPSIFFRGRALKGSLDGPGLHRLFTADTVWGIAALLWLATGLARAFGGLEKGSAFYLASPLFWLKITLFATVGLVAEPVNLDPAQVTDLNSNRVGRRLVETLVTFPDESTQIVPGLAESWTVSKDGLRYTFKLRKGIASTTAPRSTPRP